MTGYTKFDPENPPPPLLTGEPNSFARRTMIDRVPGFIEQVLEDYQARYPEAIKQELQRLHDEVREDQPIQPLETTAPDGDSWTRARQPYQNKTWLDVPWYFAEVFFYRRLLEAAGYFGRYGDQWKGVDPFLPRKQAELHNNTTWQIVDTALQLSSQKSASSFKGLLYYALWGNRLDLSHSQLAGSVEEISVDSEQANLLVDDSQAVLDYLQQAQTSSPSSPRIDFICDNAGTELLMDLVLADFLLQMNWAGSVTLHVKFHPTFISDATATDVNLTIATLKAKEASPLNHWADRLLQFRQTGRLQVQANRFWNSSRFFWEIPQPLQRDLAQAYLVIFKGDANYRRLLGDSRWPTTVPPADAVPYFPTAWVALRTMKSDPIVGLEPGRAERLNKEDPEWRVNGQRGIVQALLFS